VLLGDAGAVQFADGGDLAPLRAMAEATDLDPFQRVRLAGSLADAGEPGSATSSPANCCHGSPAAG